MKRTAEWMWLVFVVGLFTLAMFNSLPGDNSDPHYPPLESSDREGDVTGNEGIRPCFTSSQGC